jgi:hypothetical protein
MQRGAGRRRGPGASPGNHHHVEAHCVRPSSSACMQQGSAPPHLQQRGDLLCAHQRGVGHLVLPGVRLLHAACAALEHKGRQLPPGLGGQRLLGHGCLAQLAQQRPVLAVNCVQPVWHGGGEGQALGLLQQLLGRGGRAAARRRLVLLLLAPLLVLRHALQQLLLQLPLLLLRSGRALGPPPSGMRGGAALGAAALLLLCCRVCLLVWRRCRWLCCILWLLCGRGRRCRCHHGSMLCRCRRRLCREHPGAVAVWPLLRRRWPPALDDSRRVLCRLCSLWVPVQVHAGVGAHG